jgi:hypothetical protein
LTVPRSRIDLGSTWQLALLPFGRRPLFAILLVPMIGLAAYAAARVPAPGIAVTSAWLIPYYHLVVIVRAAAVALIASIFGFRLVESGGLTPHRSQRRALSSIVGRVVVAVLMTIGSGEIFVSPTDLASAAISDWGSFPISLLLELLFLIALRAALAAASLVGVPDALIGRQRERAQPEGAILFVACLLPFALAGVAEVAIWLIVGQATTVFVVEWVAFGLDAAAMSFAIVLAFANHRRFAPEAAEAHSVAAFD